MIRKRLRTRLLWARICIWIIIYWFVVCKIKTKNLMLHQKMKSFVKCAMQCIRNVAVKNCTMHSVRQSVNHSFIQSMRRTAARQNILFFLLLLIHQLIASYNIDFHFNFVHFCFVSFCFVFFSSFLLCVFIIIQFRCMP